MQQKTKKKNVWMPVLLCAFLFLIIPVNIQASMKMNVKQKTLVSGQVFQMQILGNRTDIHWSSTRKKVAVISESGKVKAKKQGTTVIKAKADGRVVKAKITVRTPKCSDKNLTLYPGDSYLLRVKNAGGADIQWKSSNPKIFSVNQQGKIKAKKNGRGKITAIVNGSYQCVCKVEVVCPQTSTALRICIPVGQSVDLVEKMTVSDAYKRKNIQWIITGTQNVTIHNGVCYATKWGNCKVTAKAGSYSREFVIYGTYGARWIAHRGYSSKEPENTIPAFEAAAQAGAWGIETDVRNTADGELVLMHDGELGRMTNVTGNVSTYTFRQLCGEDAAYLEKNPAGIYIDAGNNSGKYTGNKLKVPTLDEYLAICKKYGVYAVIELKDFTAGKTESGTAFSVSDMVKKLYMSIKKYNMEEHSILISFYKTELTMFRGINETAAKNIPMQLLCGAVSTATIEQAKQIGNCNISFNGAAVGDGETANRLVHDAGLTSTVWTIDDAGTQMSWKTVGVDYLTANVKPAW